ncbi:Hypothetical protein GLP15_2835 [Giardia lamblia P15]|uniref:Uncharacterized protein n=1 Tax=Giardia intestinalis (strain P15) TaxID=658858 RepID=E1F4D4_GIAIA|nr:Hypothetical protein GLP15_2835 [Giardia lamblia P15]
MSKAHTQQTTRQQLDERSQQVEALMVLLTEKDDEISQLKGRLVDAIASAKEDLRSEAEQKLRQKLAIKLHAELREKMMPDVRAELKEELRINILAQLSEQQIIKYLEKPLEERTKAIEAEMESRIAEQVEQRLQKEVTAQVAKEKAAFRNKLSEAARPKSKDSTKAEEQRLRVQIASLESKHLCEVQTLTREINSLKKRIAGYETTIELLRSQNTSLASELSDTQKALKMAAESLADQHEREEQLKNQIRTQQAAQLNESSPTNNDLDHNSVETSVTRSTSKDGNEEQLYFIHNARSAPVAPGSTSLSQELAPAVDLNTNTAVYIPGALHQLSNNISDLPSFEDFTKRADEIWTNENFEQTKQDMEIKMRNSCTSSRIADEEVTCNPGDEPKTGPAETFILPLVSNLPVHVSGDIGFSAVGVVSMSSSTGLDVSSGTSTGPIVELQRSITTSGTFGQSSLEEYLTGNPLNHDSANLIHEPPPLAKERLEDKVVTETVLERISPDVVLRKNADISELQAAMVRHFTNELREQSKFMESSPLQIPDGQLGSLIESAIQFLFKVWDYIEEAFALRNSCLNGIRTCLDQGSLDSALKLAQVELLRCRKVKEEFGDIFELVRERELKKANEESTSDITSTLQVVLEDCNTELLYRGFPYSNIIRAETS